MVNSVGVQMLNDHEPRLLFRLIARRRQESV